MHKEMESRFQPELRSVKNVRDLKQYLRDRDTTSLAEIIEPAIEFFAKDHRKEDASRDWKTIRKQIKLGLTRPIIDDTKLSPRVTRALHRWITDTHEGRQLGKKPSSDAIVENPREEALCVLEILGRSD